MTRRRRILFLVNAFELDAPTRLTATMAEAMLRRGWDVRLVAWSRGGELAARLTAAGIEKTVLAKGMMGSALAVGRLIRDFKPDIVHAALVRPNIGYAMARLFSRRFRTRLIAADHGVHEWHERGAATGWLMDRLMPAVLSQADIITTVSADARNQLIQHGLPSELITVIPNGIDVTKYYPRPYGNRDQFIAQTFPDAKPGEIQYLIGAAGNLRRLKGFDSLLAAMPEVTYSHPGCRLVIWGKGPEEKALREQVAELGLQQFVALAGYDFEMETRLPLLDVYVQPSRVESFGLGAAEAMATGLPVVVTSAGGLPELVDDGKSGVTVPPDDPAALAAHITELLNSPQQWALMGEAARLRIVQRYSQQGMIDAMAALYEQILPESDVPDE